MRRIILFFCFLSILALACSLPASAPQPEPTADNRLLETLVATKLTAAVAAGTPSPLPPDPIGQATPQPPVTSTFSVVYTSSGNLWLRRENLPAAQLTSSGQDENPTLSSDGQVVAFTRNGQLYAVNADGSNERQLASQAYLDSFKTADVARVSLRKFAFIPGTHSLLFDIIGLGDGYPFTYYDLHRVDADKPAPSRILAENKGGGAWSFSPDGNWLAISAADTIRLMRPDGSDYQVLFKFKLVSTYSEWFYFPQVIWMRDASGLYTVIPASAALDNPQEPSRFYFIPLKGDPAKLAEFVAAPVWISMPQLAPDGTKIAYMRPAGNALELHIVDASTADRVFANAPADSFGLLGWNPNAKDFTYFSGSTNSAWLARLDSPPAPLVDTPEITSLRWLDDRRFIFISRGELRLREIGKPSSTLAADVSEYDVIVLK